MSPRTNWPLHQLATLHLGDNGSTRKQIRNKFVNFTPRFISADVGGFIDSIQWLLNINWVIKYRLKLSPTIGNACSKTRFQSTLKFWTTFYPREDAPIKRSIVQIDKNRSIHTHPRGQVLQGVLTFDTETIPVLARTQTDCGSTCALQKSISSEVEETGQGSWLEYKILEFLWWQLDKLKYRVYNRGWATFSKIPKLLRALWAGKFFCWGWFLTNFWRSMASIIKSSA